MARPPSPDPAKKITISIPLSLWERGRLRAQEFSLNYSKYLQLLIQTDADKRPTTLNHGKGEITSSTDHEERKRQHEWVDANARATAQSRVNEDPPGKTRAQS